MVEAIQKQKYVNLSINNHYVAMWSIIEGKYDLKIPTIIIIVYCLMI